jgi:nucleoside-specific outer membrane channel protein Tsx
MSLNSWNDLKHTHHYVRVLVIFLTLTNYKLDSISYAGYLTFVTSLNDGQPKNTPQHANLQLTIREPLIICIDHWPAGSLEAL